MGRLTYILAVSALFGITWMLITARLTLESFGVGFLISALIIVLVGTRDTATMQPARLPRQAVSLILYTLKSFVDITVASFDVARRVLHPKLPLKPGIVAIPTQDAQQSETIAALSAHAITITPGQLAVDFDGAKTMYIHCLDIDSAQESAQEQAKRLKALRAILGKD
jgi:multicomponent Na+:H+ antiporter subunit E